MIIVPSSLISTHRWRADVGKRLGYSVVEGYTIYLMLCVSIFEAVQQINYNSRCSIQ